MMSWFSEPQRRPRYRDDSPKRYYPAPQTRRVFPTRGPRRSRIISWGLCILAALLIAFWPRNGKDTIMKPHPKPAPKVTAKDRRQATSYRSEKKPSSVQEKAEHVYRQDGLLDVNPKARHPIFELIERSETQWKRKVERQSKTLDQAVQEYRRRYGRPPPKGFEVWWDYVDFHDVQLVDEYDSINARIEPFWGVDPRNLHALQAEWEAHDDTFTIGKVDGADIVLLNETMRGAKTGALRAQEQIDILEDVQEYLPDFRATFTMHDGPTQFVSWEMKQRAEEAASVGEYIDVDRVAKSIQATGWASACPPGSPIHTYSPSDTPAFPSGKKSFIYNHRLSMDPCLHPSHLTLNGYLSQYHRGPNPHRKMIPSFSICASSLHNDILTVAPEQFVEEITSDPSWEDKPDERLLWRGSNTGILYQDGNEWNKSHRVRLIETGTRRGGTMRVLTPRDLEDAPVGHGEEFRTSLLNPAFMDVAFVGKPLQCRGAVCEKLKQMFEWRGHQSWKDAWQYKYIMDIDGNGWSARFKRLMTSKSLIFKCTIFPEWYTERIMPWVHYIPIQVLFMYLISLTENPDVLFIPLKVDLSDLYDALMFFRGDLSGMGAHDDLARNIATAGKKWSETFYRREDMTAYHFRLFLEYARVMSEDRESMHFREDSDTD